MKGNDMMEALSLVEEKYVEEAGQKEENGAKRNRYSWKRYASIAAISCAALLVSGSATALALDSFSSIKGDELDFERVEYLGDGIVSVQVTNHSDKVLVFQEEVKLCTFYGNQVIPQTQGGSVKMQGNVVQAHSSSEMLIDLSGAYDMAVADQPLVDDWYYLLLTNDRFIFGQDWQCTVDFQNSWKTAEEEPFSEMPGKIKEQKEISVEDFVYEAWVSPTEELRISSGFGAQDNGGYSDHINIAGETGDSVFAVCGGVIAETGFEAKDGNYIILQAREGVKIKYAHLKEASVEAGGEVKAGERIGTVGKSGMAAGPNLSLTLYVDGEAVNPLKED